MNDDTAPRLDPWRTALWAGVLALGFAIAYLGVDIATGAATFFTHDGTLSDFWHLNVPLKKLLQDAYARGSLPLWADEIGTGFPLFAEGQVAALYPLNLLLFGTLPLALALNWATLLNLALAAAGTALFARGSGLARGASIFAGLAFAFSAFFVLHVKHPNLTQSAAWLPFALFAIERCRAGSRSAPLGLALVATLTILAGHPQIAFQHAVVCAAYVLLLLFSRTPAGGPTRDRFLMATLAAAVWGAMLAAPQWFSTIALAEAGERQGGLPLEVVTAFGIDPRYLWLLVDPFRYGDPGLIGDGTFNPFTRPSFYWELCYFVGRLTLGLAVPGLVIAIATRRASAGRRLVIIAAATGAIALGPLIPALHEWVPGFDRFRFPSRYFLYVAFAFVILAAIAIDRLARRLAGRRRWWGAAVPLIAVAVTLAESWIAFGDHNPHIAADRWLEPPTTAKAIKARLGNGPERIADYDPERVVFTNASRRAKGWKGDLTPYDVPHRMLAPAQNALYGIGNLNHYHPLTPRSLDYIAKLYASPDPRSGRPPHVGVASLFGVRFIVSPAPALSAGNHGLTRAASFEGDIRCLGKREVPFEIHLYENERVLPRAFVVPRAIRIAGRPRNDAPGLDGAEATVLERLALRSFDPRREVLITDPAATGAPIVTEEEAKRDDAPSGTPGRATIRPDDDPTVVTIAVEATEASWLFLSDTPYPGWEVTINGEPATWWPANLGGRAVPVPPGESDVVFHYRPRPFRYGLIASAIGVVALLVLTARRRRVA